MNKRVAMLLTVLLGLAVFVPLAAEEAQPVALNVLKDFSSATRDGAVVIGVTGTYPILDFTYYDYDPETFVVDLADVDASQIPRELSVNSGAVSTVKVEPISRAKGRSLTKLEVHKAYLAKCLVSTEGNRLVVRVVGAGEAPPPVAPAVTATPAAPVPAPEPRAEVQSAPAPVQAAEGKPARTLTGVEVVEGGSEVRLLADGSAKAKSFALPNPDRIVVDLPGVGRGTVPSKLAGQGNVQQVRVSLFQADPLITRVVLDLAEGQKDWRVSSEGESVVVRFGARAETVQAQEPAVPSAPAAPSPEASQVTSASSSREVAPAIEQVKVELTPMAPSASKEFKGYEDLFVAQDASATTPEGKTLVAGGVPLSFKEKTISGGQMKYSGEPISLSLKDADVKDVLRVFHDLSKMNIVVHPAVAGKVTVDLENVPWDQAMDIILKNNNLDYVYENSVIWVAPSSEISRKFSEQQKLQDERLKAEESVTFTKRLSYAKADTMKGIVSSFLSPKGQIYTDPRTNTMIIQEVPSQKDGLVKLIDTLDTATPQVLIEARIVETSVSWNQQFGIQWSGNWFTAGPATGPVTWDNGGGNTYTAQQFGNSGWPNYGSGDFAVNMLPTASNGFIDLMLGNISGSFMLDVKLAAMEDTGRGRVLSAPRILTQDNEKASIESGRQIPIQVATSDKITVVFVNATLKLEVTPQISADGNVNMTVNITNDSIDFKNALPTGPPPIIKKEAKTVLKVRDGQTQVIGGIFVTNEGVSQKGLPFLSKIPVLGWLFKNRNKTRQNDELLIFLTPKIVR